MKSIAVVGAGAVGCYYGGRLAAAGEDVRFLMRSDLEAVREGGLTVESVAGDFRLEAPQVFGSSGEIGPVDLVMVAWKATSNDHYEEVIAPLLHDGTAILTLQNGLGNTERLAELFGAGRVLGGLCFVCINRVARGVIRHSASGLMTVGEFSGGLTPRLLGIGRQFRAAAIDCREVEHLAEAQWKKLAWNVPFNGFTIAEGGIDTEALLARPGMEDEVRAVMREVVAGAAALGHRIPDGFIEELLDVTRPMGPYRPSSMIDFEAGRDVEVEAI
ncbi:MAG: 2-dehydropantoate 2-reductase, partial [Akkermansiaceae bacterium]|nr:2-dehydropantoate 2-reductase [Akkermansiaceae bacterium]